MDLIGEGFWCWGSLRSWQILHSRLAEGSCVNDIDLWQLMDEARNESERYQYNGDVGYEDEEEGAEDGDSEADEEGGGHNGSDGDDEDGYITAKFREWAAVRQQEEEAIMRSYIHNIRSESRVFYDDVEQQLAEQVIDNSNGNDSNNLQSEVGYGDAGASGYEDNDGYLNSQEGDNNSDNINDITETISTTLSNYNCNVNREIAETRYCSCSSNRQVIEKARRKSKSTEDMNDGQLQDDYYFYSDNNGAYIYDEICPICLDKLHVMIDEKWQGISRLACRHSFHSDCLSPWVAMQRSAETRRCPCCRSPVEFLNADHHHSVAAADDGDDQQPVDIMGLLADMEAALDRFGLLA